MPRPASSSTPSTTVPAIAGGPHAAAAALLGGATALRRPVRTDFDLHDVIMQGIPGGALAFMLEHVESLPTEDVLKAVGVSARTVQRRNQKPRKSLSPEQSGRAWKFAEVLAKASDVLGGQGPAEEWLASPAFGLGNRRPIDLLSSPVGASMVEQLLGRIEHGIYS